MEQQYEEKWYSYYLCKDRRYLLGEIKKIDSEYLLKIDSYNLGVIMYTSNYSYRFERTNTDGYIFKERVDLDDKTKNDLKELKPLTKREGNCYFYSEKDLKLERLAERIERIEHKLMKLKRKNKKKDNFEDSLD